MEYILSIIYSVTSDASTKINVRVVKFTRKNKLNFSIKTSLKPMFETKE